MALILALPPVCDMAYRYYQEILCETCNEELSSKPICSYST